MKALICEDNTLALKVLEVTLRRLNFEVIVARDGDEGIRHLQEESVNLLVTDINMPYNNGLEVVEYLRKHSDRRIPIIIVTNINLEETRKHAKELGADAYITKPFDPDELVKAINSLNIPS